MTRQGSLIGRWPNIVLELLGAATSIIIVTETRVCLQRASCNFIKERMKAETEIEKCMGSKRNEYVFVRKQRIKYNLNWESIHDDFMSIICKMSALYLQQLLSDFTL